MKKLVVLAAGMLAACSAALFGAGAATSDPNGNASLYNVVGEPYYKAVAILKNMGVKATFGGSRGSALPQSQCLVDSQKINSSGKMLLMLDCTSKAAEQVKESGGPTVGGNGITTVTPTPVVPIQGAPGAGTPPPA